MREVVNAAIIRDNRILLVKDRDRRVWTFPGGEVEEDESREGCLRRELKEELNGVESAFFVLFDSCRGKSLSTGDPLLIFLYRAEVEGYLRPGDDVSAIAWVLPCTSYHVSDPTRTFLKALKDRGHLM